MIFLLGDLINWIKRLLIEDRTFGAARSSQWSRVRGENIKSFCELCEKKGGLLKPLELHHVEPFHLKPELELSPTNFITVCRHCHLYFAHLGNFKSFNIDIKKEAELWQEKRKNRP